MFQGYSGVVPGCCGGVPGMFRGVPGCSGLFRAVPGCSRFYRHPLSGVIEHNFFLLVVEIAILSFAEYN